MDPYVVNIMLDTSVHTHISLLYAGMVVHMHDPYSRFHSNMVRIHRMLWALLIVAHWVSLFTL